MTNYMENLTKNLDAMYAGKIGSAIVGNFQTEPKEKKFSLISAQIGKIA